MNARHSSMPSKEFSRHMNSPISSPTLHPKHSLDIQLEEKARHVSELHSRYNQRLMKPLHVNQKLKLHAEMGIVDSDRQRRLMKRTWLKDEEDRKQLANQVKELMRISSYHDKEDKKIRRKIKRNQKRNVLEDHLEADLFNFIMEVNEKAEKIKRARTVEEKNKYRTETQDEDEGNLSVVKKHKNEFFHNQLVAIKQEKDKNLPLKQLNSNLQFRHSQRKLLCLRSMELEKNADESSEMIAGSEDTKQSSPPKFKGEKRSSDSFYPLSFMAQERNSSSTGNLNEKLPLTFQKPRQGLNTLNIFNREAVVHKPTEPSSVKSVKRGLRIQFAGQEAYTEPSMVGSFTPTNTYSAIDTNIKPFDMGHFDNEMGSQASDEIASHFGRMLSQATFKEMRTPEIPERDEDETHRGEEKPLEIKEPPKKQEKANVFKRPKLLIQTSSDFSVRSAKKIESSNRTGPGGELVISRRVVTQTDEEKVEASELLSRKMKENFRANLLENIKKAKVNKNCVLQESCTNESSSALLSRKWLGVTHTAFLEPTKWKSPDRVGKRGASKKKLGNRSRKNTKGHRTITDMDQEEYLRELSTEKVPLKEEMEDILTRYGYKNGMIEVTSPSHKSGRKLKENGVIRIRGGR